MSFGDKAILWLHIVAVVFTIGPGTAAIMSTPRYIRNRNPAIVGFLFRTTRIYTFGSLLVLVFGLILTAMTHKFNQWWISVSLTLFVVAFVLLMLILHYQRRAISALDAAVERPAPVAGGTVADGVEEEVRADAEAAEAGTAPVTQAAPVTGAAPGAAAPSPPAAARPAAVAAPPRAGRRVDSRLVAAVERSRIASFGGVASLIWVVILVLMVWH